MILRAACTDARSSLAPSSISSVTIRSIRAASAKGATSMPTTMTGAAGVSAGIDCLANSRGPNEQHVVPLSRQALAILRELRVLTGDGKYLFPSLRTPSRCLSDNTVNAALRRLGYSKEAVMGCAANFELAIPSTPDAALSVANRPML